ncbi:MAG TPA: type II toxin-antitoxin system RelE/ParE family toxin [Blastocatellia bacterium]|nr:type II toxin-antitoxin system RelE/ParE family toxin [Blastocatellia bacterium]
MLESSHQLKLSKPFLRGGQMIVKWLQSALDNLDHISIFIAQDNPDAAKRVVAKIQQDIAIIASYPASGRQGRVPGTREMIVSGTPYIIIYRIHEQTVEILRVFHTKQRSAEIPLPFCLLSRLARLRYNDLFRSLPEESLCKREMQSSSVRYARLSQNSRDH